MRTAKMRVEEGFKRGEALYITGDTIEVLFGEAVYLFEHYPTYFSSLDSYARHAQAIASGDTEPDEDEAIEITFGRFRMS